MRELQRTKLTHGVKRGCKPIRATQISKSQHSLRRRCCGCARNRSFDNSEMEESLENTGGGDGVARGRGRGRGGGVPLLPSGMWNDLVNTDDQSSSEHKKRNFENDQTLEEMKQMTFGGGGRGRGKHVLNDDRGPPRGFARDAKGTDWNCPSCGNTNWSWRTNCNRCSTAKPVVKVYAEGEVRDGIGGGFNERQDRVATTTVEIAEDGFDDFGRRVKGGRQEKSAKELAALARLQHNYGFLLNAEGVMGQYDDSLEEKKKKTASLFVKDEKGKSDNTSTKSNPSDRYVPPIGKDTPQDQRKDRRDRKSRSRSRDNRRERDDGNQRYPDQDRERDSRRDSRRDWDRSRERDSRR